MAYGLSFAAISSLIVYTFLHNRKQIYRQYKNSTTEKPDIHMKLMRKYKEAPTWWYMSLFAVVSKSRHISSQAVSLGPAAPQLGIQVPGANAPEKQRARTAGGKVAIG